MNKSWHYHTENGSELVIERWENMSDGNKVFAYKVQHYMMIEIRN